METYTSDFNKIVSGRQPRQKVKFLQRFRDGDFIEFCRRENFKTYMYSERLRWSRGSVLAFGTQVRGFKPGRSRF